jgi:signal transduction histidine kinase
MKNHRGGVLVSSFAGQGSVFDLLFPQREGEAPAAGA